MTSVLWFVLWFFTMSFVEHYVHRNFMHRKSPIHLWFPRVFENHAVNHHRKYFKLFNFEPDEKGRHENIQLQVLPSLPLALLLAGVAACFSWRSGLMFLAAVLVHHLIWNLIHQEMHNPNQRFFAHWGVYKFLARYHLMHHRYPGKNFNVVVPLADFVFGTYAFQNAKDRLSMIQYGLWNPAWAAPPVVVETEPAAPL